MKQNAITQAIAKFFKTTTLHGFKYLLSEYKIDRIGWVISCFTSACCAGVLCVVLWDRFLKVPALLQLRDLGDEVNFQLIPTVAVCQPSDAVAETFLKHLRTNGMNTTRIPATLVNALQGKPTEARQIHIMEDLLELNNMSLTEVLSNFTLECTQLVRACRWRGSFVDCAQLFRKELTRFGVCCVATPARFLNTTVAVIHQFDVILKLDVGLQCLHGSGNHGCEFFTRYVGEEWITPTRLSPGYNYLAQLTFISERDNNAEKLVDGSCISSTDYSRSNCLLKCTEKECGCSDPLRKNVKNENTRLPLCPLNRLSCLRTFGLQGNTTCSCLPGCQKIMTKLMLESGPIQKVKLMLDPIYSDINITQGLVLQLRINLDKSKLFLLIPTETWLTLLSSLGGVFNMFLGVGLFSALEFLFLMLVKVPIAIRSSTEMRVASVANPTGAMMFNKVE